MNARNKLNIAYGNGSLIIAALAGLVVQSWPIFVVALIGLLLMNWFMGEIRPKPKNH